MSKLSEIEARDADDTTRRLVEATVGSRVTAFDDRRYLLELVAKAVAALEGLRHIICTCPYGSDGEHRDDCETLIIEQTLKEIQG